MVKSTLNNEKSSLTNSKESSHNTIKDLETNSKNPLATNIKWFDSYTKNLLAIMCVILIFIVVSGTYMAKHNMEAGGTDDTVNTLATENHHPLVELPGDAQVGAFSVTNLFAGLIIGHHWDKLFGKRKDSNLREE